MKKSRLIALFAVVCFLAARGMEVVAGSPGAKEQIMLTCLTYAQETLCYPQEWYEGTGTFYKYGRKLGAVSFAPNGDATVNHGPKERNWAQVDVRNLSESKEEKDKHYSNPIMASWTEPCGAETPGTNCYKPLGKKKVSEFEAFYYLIEGGNVDRQWTKEMAVYLVKPPNIYEFKIATHKDDFNKYQRYFYTMLANFHLNKKSRK